MSLLLPRVPESRVNSAPKECPADALVDDRKLPRIIAYSLNDLVQGLAEVAEKYLRKGSQVYIEGRLQTRSWDDQNGQKRYTTEIVADNMVMLGRPAGGGGGPRESGDSYSQQNEAPAMPSRSSGGAPGYGGGTGGSGYSAPSSMPPQAEDDLPF